MDISEQNIGYQKESTNNALKNWDNAGYSRI